MFYEIVLKNGDIISRISEEQYKKVDEVLLTPREERPDFVKIKTSKGPRTIPWNMVADLGLDRLNWQYGYIK